VLTILNSKAGNRTIHRRTPLKIAALVWTCALAGCSGGSDNPPAAAEESRVFAAASGALCAQRDAASGNCVEPTSSSARLESLKAALLNPGGEKFNFNSFGWAVAESRTTLRGQYTAGGNAYSLLKKPLVLGRKTILADGKTYNYAQEFLGSERFVSGEEPFDVGFGLPGAMTIAQQYNGTLSNSGTLQSGITSIFGRTQWRGLAGLLTDTRDAPTESEITYTAEVSVWAGDGSPFAPERNVFSSIWGGCPITLVFTPATGALKAGAAKCTSAGPDIYTTQVQFDLPALFFERSRVMPLVASEASIAISGLASDQPGADVSAVFKAPKIEGGLYGAGAKYLYITGVGPLGAFEIRGVRK
jgi:hypothetical protein